jgi:hypothetical protein
MSNLQDSFFDLSPGVAEYGYPDLNYNAMNLIRQFDDFNHFSEFVYNDKRKVDKDCPSYSIISSFFDAVVDALKTMKGKIQLEILEGEMCQALLSMKLGTGVDKLRPSYFPRNFMRIWQSNVP